jgi:cytochrome c-type biogenesis protein CcmH/NrfG
MKTYSKMVDAQANLFAAHGLNEQAEEAYRLAIQLNPTIPEGVFGYVELLSGQNRMQDALAVAQAAADSDPKNTQFQTLVAQLQKSSEQTAAK